MYVGMVKVSLHLYLIMRRMFLLPLFLYFHGAPGILRYTNNHHHPYIHTYVDSTTVPSHSVKQLHLSHCIRNPYCWVFVPVTSTTWWISERSHYTHMLKNRPQASCQRRSKGTYMHCGKALVRKAH